MSSILDKRIFSLLQKRYGARDTTIKEALNWIENSKWLEDRGYYETVSGDFYNKERNTIIEATCLLNPSKEFQLIIPRKEKEAEKWMKKRTP